MGLLLKQIMLEKDMFLKKNNFILILTIALLLISKKAVSNENELLSIVNYFNKLNNFSASFLQVENQEIVEGQISIGINRLRLDYTSPSKILIILGKDKGMYFNYDLNEDEFFNTNNTSAKFFFDIFKNKDFLLDSKISEYDNNLVIKKVGYNNEEFFDLTITLENNPLVLRKIELKYENNEYTLSIFNHKFDIQFDEKFFKLINPYLLN